MLRADYHMHSISPDARVSMEKMCEAAVEQGLTEVAFTDHYEFYAHGVHRKFFHADYVKQYWEELEQCREQFAGKLTIRSGMEFGQLHLCPQDAFAIIREYPFDYLIGSVHKIENVDLGQMDFNTKNINQVTESYYRHLIELSAYGEYDCLGHLNLIRRYLMRAGYRPDEDSCLEYVDEVLRNVIARGKGIEINTSGLRQGVQETLPGLRTLRRYRELGGTIVTVGSDSHRTQDVGADFDAAEKLLREAGFTEISAYERRRAVPGQRLF